MMLQRHLAAGLLASTAVLAAGAAGATITYSVDQTIGLGSVVGTIQTDGATGVLTAGDITAYDLELNGVGASLNLTNVNSSAFVSGDDLTATPLDLFFDFSAANTGYLLFQVSFGSASQYYCNAAGYGVCFQGKTVTPQSIYVSSFQNVPAVGNQIIGVAGVPEPATWALMLIGAVGVGASLRGRKAHAATV